MDKFISIIPNSHEERIKTINTSTPLRTNLKTLSKYLTENKNRKFKIYEYTIHNQCIYDFKLITKKDLNEKLSKLKNN